MAAANGRRPSRAASGGETAVFTVGRQRVANNPRPAANAPRADGRTAVFTPAGAAPTRGGHSPDRQSARRIERAAHERRRLQNGAPAPKNTQNAAPRPAQMRYTAVQKKRPSPAAGKPETHPAPRRRVAVRSFTPRINIKTVKTAAAPFPIGIIISCAFCAMLFMFILFNMVRINEKNDELQSLKSQASELAATKTELTLKLDAKNNLVTIADYAVNRLGMVTSDQLSRQYLEISYEDSIIPAESKGGSSFRLTGLFRSLGDKIEEIIEYLR